jgi:2-keto-4-pentenoate hydratase/2-oxohepta-3-ene-1,7-dioic acid hydratase in catechol pathway
MTRRDLQKAMGDHKQPWEVGKSFDHAAVVSHLQPIAEVGHLKDAVIWLKVNDQRRQFSNINLMKVL